MKPSLHSLNCGIPNKHPPAGRLGWILCAAGRGALLGLAAGLLALGGVLAVSWRCLPYHISLPAQPWPWYCAEPAFGAIGYLAFPVNLITNDLARAIRLAPVPLLLYALLGALVGMALSGISHLRMNSAC